MTVSELCLGTATFGRELSMHGREPLDAPIVDKETAHDLLTLAADHGINFIDTADTYGRPDEGRTERYIGEWLADRNREEFVISSKVGLTSTQGGPTSGGLSRKHLRVSINETLDRLGTDYLDIYYIHVWDDDTPIDETLRTLDDLVSEGIVHYLGASNLAAWQLAQAVERSSAHELARFDVLQAKYNAANRAPVADLIDVCVDQGLALCPYSPLEGGFLSGKYERDGAPPAGSRADRDSTYGEFSPHQWDVLEAVSSVADEIGASTAQVAVRWLIDHDRVPTVPVVGPRTTSQLLDTLEVAKISLSSEQYVRITDAYHPE